MLHLDVESEVPIYLQIARELEDAVFVGAFLEESQVPSTTEISTTQRINPATVLKGMNLLVDDGILYKKRGLGMFVSTGAVDKIREKRQDEFYGAYIERMIAEAKKLGIDKESLKALIERGYEK